MLLNPVLTTLEDSSANSAPLPHSDRTYNNRSDAYLVGASSDTFQCSGDDFGGEDGRAPQVGALPAPTRPERAFTHPLPLGLAMRPEEIRCSVSKRLTQRSYLGICYFTT